MTSIADVVSNLIGQTAFMNLTFGNLIMILVAFVFLFLALKMDFEPLLLVPIAFGMLLVNIYPDIMIAAEEASNGTPGLLHVFYILDEWSVLAFSDLPGSGCDDRLWSPDRKSQEFPHGCCSTVRYLCSIFPGDLYGIQWKGSSGHLHYRRS